MVTCFVGIGSNLGDRAKFIKSAINKISRLKGTRVIKISRIIETEPHEGPLGQGKFLNACLKITTTLTPLILLKNLKKIERELGRPKKHIRYGPRTIDLDILFYGNRVIKKKDLLIPHPKICERDFVMRPLLEII